MSNVCEKLEEIEYSTKGGQQPTLMEIYTEMNRLKLENECLKADNYELKKQNLQLRSDINVLHNRLNENNEEKDDPSMLNEYEEEYLCGCESEEDFNAYEEALNNCSVKN
jgi:hypothetical protein